MLTVRLVQKSSKSSRQMIWGTHIFFWPCYHSYHEICVTFVTLLPFVIHITFETILSLWPFYICDHITFETILSFDHISFLTTLPLRPYYLFDCISFVMVMTFVTFFLIGICDFVTLRTFHNLFCPSYRTQLQFIVNQKNIDWMWQLNLTFDYCNWQ